MSNPQYTLAWEAYQKNICNGLGALQERGEFVDMTLAADGHLVKVHKMVLSLVSPYIKDLIATAECAHPVIFLNNITYKTLSSILEYIYTGQVCVSKDELGDLIQAGKALYIKGLVDMMESCNTQNSENDLATLEVMGNASMQMHDYESTSYMDDNETSDKSMIKSVDKLLCPTEGTFDTEVSCSDETPVKSRVRRVSTVRKRENAGFNSQIQYTMSNQGNLQIILNRYVYNVRYLYKNSNRRMWRCIFYPKQLRCPAYVVTEGDEIVERSCTHNHMFHDKNIMRKVREGRVFAMLKDAQLHTEIRKRTKAGNDIEKSDDAE